MRWCREDRQLHRRIVLSQATVWAFKWVLFDFVWWPLKSVKINAVGALPAWKFRHQNTKLSTAIIIIPLDAPNCKLLAAVAGFLVVVPQTSWKMMPSKFMMFTRVREKKFLFLLRSLLSIHDTTHVALTPLPILYLIILHNTSRHDPWR